MTSPPARLSAITILGLILALVGPTIAPVPAMAKKKKVSEEWTATAPVSLPRRCDMYGVEGVTRSAHPFTAPFVGHPEVTMTGYLGDWDLMVLNQEEQLIAASQTQESTEDIEVPLVKGAEVTILACNYGGGQTAELSLLFSPLRPCERKLRCAA
jgi:hypothetical protein